MVSKNGGTCRLVIAHVHFKLRRVRRGSAEVGQITAEQGHCVAEPTTGSIEELPPSLSSPHNLADRNQNSLR
jgi:hypothetical protein